MNITEVRRVIRQTIAEAMEKGGLPKSGGKLVHLKKEMEGLKKMKESLGQLQIAEGGDQQFVAEYAHMQKFVNEINKIKEYDNDENNKYVEITVDSHVNNILDTDSVINKMKHTTINQKKTKVIEQERLVEKINSQGLVGS